MTSIRNLVLNLSMSYDDVGKKHILSALLVTESGDHILAHAGNDEFWEALIQFFSDVEHGRNVDMYVLNQVKSLFSIQ